ncbi:MAG: UBP-type zinc finger domain-containing protein [Kofleriaceae bacterium]
MAANIDLTAPCEHVPAIKIHHVKRPAPGCEDCLKIGGWWVHLRECLECGHIGCCDSSPNKHATAHYHHTKHPIITSVEVGENWSWCYVDDRFLSE